ncbi:MAG: DNA-processing protein DprA [Candidatus Omnitrophota bacterium]|nr:MAG: DNA-processing protein DprA [Candidatus Omnitrophota bacterium]
MAKQGSIFLNLLNLAPKKLDNIISFLDDPDLIFTASRKELRAIASLYPKDIEEIVSKRESGALEEELKSIERKNIKVIDLFDDDYPELLRQISFPPLVLYVKGKSQVLNKPLFAMVGTRMPTKYGIAMAQEFSHNLSMLGFVIVSGLARGIDTASHRGAIKKGETIAVLGSGLLNIYPRENTNLAEKISEQGAVLSEFPLYASPRRENFPRRNRIVSGLSCGVLIVEAAARSGALITAHLALEQNREVFALAGRVDSPVSKGAHILIKEGAKLVDSIEDILEELNISFEKETNPSCAAKQK